MFGLKKLTQLLSSSKNNCSRFHLVLGEYPCIPTEIHSGRQLTNAIFTTRISLFRDIFNDGISNGFFPFVGFATGNNLSVLKHRRLCVYSNFAAKNSIVNSDIRIGR